MRLCDTLTGDRGVAPPPPGGALLLAGDWAGATTGSAILPTATFPPYNQSIYNTSGQPPNIQPVPLSSVEQFTVLQAEAATRVQFVTSPVRQGTHSLRMEVHQYDWEAGVAPSKERVQAGTWRTPRTFIPMFSDVWTAISIYLDSTFVLPTTSAQWKILLQLKGDSASLVGGGSPPISIAINQNQQLYVYIRGGEKSSAGAAAPYAASHFFGSSGAGVKGVWHDFLIHTVLDYVGVNGYSSQVDGSAMPGGGTGKTEIWHREGGGTGGISGSAVVDNGPNSLRIGGVDYGYWPYLCIYRAGIPQPDVMYYGGCYVADNRVDAESLWA